MAIVGYAYAKRKADLPDIEQTLRDAGADPVWADCGPVREELQTLLGPNTLALRHGDTLTVRNRQQFGRWARKADALAHEIGFEIQTLANQEKAPGKPGRPSLINPVTDDEITRLKAAWESPGDHAYIETEAARILGQRVRWWNVRDWYKRKFRVQS